LQTLERNSPQFVRAQRGNPRLLIQLCATPWLQAGWIYHKLPAGTREIRFGKQIARNFIAAAESN